MKVIFAYLCLFLSLTLFIINVLAQIIGIEWFYNDLLFYISAIILLVSILLFRNLLNPNKKKVVSEINRNQYNKFIEVDYQDIIIKGSNYHNKGIKKDFEDIDFSRADTLFSSRRNKNINEYNICNSFIIYKSKKNKEYLSQNINLDSKTLDIKLYIQKKIKLYINDNNGDYFFDLNFLNN